jgi:hypothetical protein
MDLYNHGVAFEPGNLDTTVYNLEKFKQDNYCKCWQAIDKLIDSDLISDSLCSHLLG